MTTQTLLLSSDKRLAFFKEVLLMLLASLLISLFTNCRVFLPHSPVPIALQPHVVLLLAATLGARRATVATLSWLGQGLMGLPVFSGGVFGVAALFGPTGGYLLGYVAAAWITGWLVERSREKSLKDIVLAMIAGNAVIYLLGAMKLSLMVGLQASLWMGVIPFLLGDALKISLLANLVGFSKRF